MPLNVFYHRHDAGCDTPAAEAAVCLDAAVHRVQRAAIRAPTREALFQEICCAALEQADYRSVRIGWTDAGSRRLMVADRDGVHGGPPLLRDAPTPAPLAADDPSAIAWRTHTPCILNEYAHDEDSSIRAAAAFPIGTGSDIGAVLTLYDARAGRFTAREIALWTESADVIALAMDRLADAGAGAGAGPQDKLAAAPPAASAQGLNPECLATLSHELRTPLNSILGFTGLLLEGRAGPVNAEQSRQLGIVRDSARQLLSLVNDALDMSSAAAGRLEIRRAPFSIAAVVEKALASIEPLADAKGLRLRLSTPAASGTLISDRRRLEQVLLNLLHNAVKFTVRGEVGLSVTRLEDHVLQPGTAAQPCVQFSVTDTGIGIRPADLAAVFEPFCRLDADAAGRQQGTGLGLTICSRLTELLGGLIRVSSIPGGGSTFAVVLPDNRP